ncbi:hypothetical protein Pyn_16980 [Prunus yedoensis var. nudiflora]|uniref:Uncharacterized protein n=1 Tax=Prunus yedoensis var. nudiflora TaxID=2094558 RepID=A0A314Z4G3_PRUYE|nr:hypothetical protein Pyn_16980 [Prunus yedoensis var. nudiflora]
MNKFYLDRVLPVQDSTSMDEYLESKQAMDDLDSPPCYPELEEIPEPEELSFFQWLSPPSSALRWESRHAVLYRFHLRWLNLC